MLNNPMTHIIVSETSPKYNRRMYLFLKVFFDYHDLLVEKYSIHKIDSVNKKVYLDKYFEFNSAYENINKLYRKWLDFRS